MQKKILVVEDESLIRGAIKDSLTFEGYMVYEADNGLAAMTAYKTANPDLIILDILLPITNGLNVAKEIRKLNTEVPIIFLSAKTQTEDVINGFNAGADDYIKKPFSLEELLVRIKARLKGTEQTEVFIFTIKGIVFNSMKQQLQLNERIILLTSKEADLLKCFLKNKNKILSKSDLLKEVWGNDSNFNSRTLDVFVSKLRVYFKDLPDINFVNIKGIGYKLLCD